MKGRETMKTTHYGQDYAYITIGNSDIEVPICIGKGVEQLTTKITQRNKQIKHLKDRIKELEKEQKSITLWANDFFGDGKENLLYSQAVELIKHYISY